MAPPTLRPARQRSAAVLLALDLVAVLAFAVIGRATHAEDLAGTLLTAAPFVAGGVAGAVLARAWRDPLSWSTGLAVWVGAVVVGLALRAAVTGRLPLSFAVVATVALAVLVLGWRAVGLLVLAARAARRAEPARRFRCSPASPQAPPTSRRRRLPASPDGRLNPRRRA